MPTPDPTPDLVTWLRGVFDEVEQTARYVLTDYAEHAASWEHPVTGVVQLGDELLPTGDGPLAEHIAHHDPAAVLADIAAKREVLKLHRAWNFGQPGEVDHCGVCMGFALGNDGRARFVPSPCHTLRALASAYLDRPGYREEWKP